MKALRLVSQELAHAVAAHPEGPSRLRELAARDLDDVWNRVKAIATCGGYTTMGGVVVPVGVETQLHASALLLAYMLGRPGEQAREAAPAAAPPSVDLSQYTPEELRAVRILQEGARRRAGG